MKRKEPLNLLFIFTDEHSVNTMGAYGNSQIDTRNLDKLADQSIVFDDCYVTQPICTPSRSSIMTGLYPHTNGCVSNNIPLSPDTPCFPELGDYTGYKRGYFGKWHLGDEIFPQHGFEEWRSIEDSYRNHYSERRDKTQHSTYHHFLTEKGFPPDKRSKDGFLEFSRGYASSLSEEFTKSAYLAREACEFLEETQGEPFILYVNFLEPHMPFFGPRNDQYDPNEIPLPPTFHNELKEDQSLAARLMGRGLRQYGQNGLPLRTESDWRRLIANYWGLVSQVDTQIGKIIDKLEELGLMENTIVVYTSDHGDMMGSHNLLTKAVMFQEAVKVPLLIKIPGMECGGRRIKAPVSQIDLVPTLLELMGQDISEHLQGHSWIPYLSGEGELKEQDVFIEWSGGNFKFVEDLRKDHISEFWKDLISTNEEALEAINDPIRTIITPEGWKYNCSLRGEDELYNLNEDPYETHNLVKDSQYTSLIGELREKIKRWSQLTDDPIKF